MGEGGGSVPPVLFHVVPKEQARSRRAGGHLNQERRSPPGRPLGEDQAVTLAAGLDPPHANAQLLAPTLSATSERGSPTMKFRALGER